MKLPLIRIGADVLRLGELDRLLGHASLCRHVYAGSELAYGNAIGAERAREFLAGRFAAKEAMMKVLGIGLLQGVPPRDIVIDRTDGGAPVVRLVASAARAAERMALRRFSLSIAHKGDIAVAVAVGYDAVPPCAMAGTTATCTALIGSALIHAGTGGA
jgi:holo-[acyl-carrier protein] synthase